MTQEHKHIAEKVLEFVEHADESIQSAFRIAGNLPGGERHLLHRYMISRGEEFSPISAASDAKALLTDASKKDIAHLACQVAEEVGSRFVELFRPTYAVANYWSPLQPKKRRSIFVRRATSSDAEHRRSVAYAYAFYALTRHGVTPKGPVRSIVQFIKESAPHRRGLFACFSDRCDLSMASHPFCSNCKLNNDQRARWICFPPQICSDLLRLLGMGQGVEEIISEPNIPTSKIEEALASLLEEFTDKHKDELGNYAERTLEVFPQMCNRLPSETVSFVESMQKHLRDFFCTDGYEGKENTRGALHETIGFQETCFMLATHLIWREACPHKTTAMYVFPVSVGASFLNDGGCERGDPCCVLTMGMDRHMTVVEELGMSRFARSMFTHPLIADFRSGEAQAQRLRDLQTYTKLVGHNLPKVVLTPAVNQLLRCQRDIQRSTNAEPSLQAALNPLQTRLDALLVVLGHHETLSSLILSAGADRNPFGKDMETFRLGDVLKIFGSLEFLFKEKMRLVWGRHQNPTPASEKPAPQDSDADWQTLLDSVSIDCRAVNCSLKIRGHRGFLQEMLINLVNNALDEIWPDDARKGRGIIALSANISTEDDGRRCLDISVHDAVGGFGKEQLQRADEMIEMIENIESLDDFLPTIGRLVTRGTTPTESRPRMKGEGLGLGLLFCAAYLKSLAWHSETKPHPGHLSIKGEERSTTVALKIPLGRGGQALEPEQS